MRAALPRPAHGKGERRQGELRQTPLRKKYSQPERTRICNSDGVTVRAGGAGLRTA